MVGYRWARHPSQCGNVSDAILGVAKNPEYAEPGRVAELFHGIRHKADGIRVRNIGDELAVGAVVVMRQICDMVHEGTSVLQNLKTWQIVVSLFTKAYECIK
jgi:hypothetical protein